MFHTYAKHFCTSLFLLSIGFSVAAQNLRNGENTPYTRFGIGEQRNGVNTLLKGMGSVSSAYANPFAVNTDNPASYGSLKLTTYEAGGEASTRTVFSGSDKYTTGMVSLSNLTVGIPVGNYAGIAIGLQPYSRVYYDMQDTALLTGIGRVTRDYFGAGNLSYAFLGAGGKYKGFSLGFNFGYMFGTINNSRTIVNIDTVNAHHGQFLTSTRTGGIYWKAGAMYETNFNKKLGIRAGATLALTQDLRAIRDEYWMSVSKIDPSISDTVFQSTGLRSDTKLPMSYTAGVQLIGIDKWMAGIDFSGAQWSEFRNFGMVDSVADNTYKISVGGEYTPDMASRRSYFQRVTYRLGFYYGQDYVRLRNTDLNFYAVTAGASFPFRRTTDRIHTAIEVGSRGTRANGLIRETFVRFSLGISLNDRWFIQRKYD